MLGHYLSPWTLAFAGFRVALACLALALGAMLWRRPRAAMAFGALLVANLVCWAVYSLPLERPYGLDEGSDRAFNVGMAACVAAGRSAFEHTQARFTSPEPLWNALVGTLSLGHPERAASVYNLLAPLSLIVACLGLYFGLRGEDDEADRWERVLITFAVLWLSSLSMNPNPPIPAFWAGNFLLKPNHACSFGVMGVLVGMRARTRTSKVAFGVLLGLLAWVFLMSWAYLIAALLVGLLLAPRGERDFKKLAVALAVSGVIAAPYVFHLARGFNPTGSHKASTHMWADALGLPLMLPHWSTLDLGPLFALGVAGAFALKRRGSSRDLALLAVLAAAFLMWIGSVAATLVGISPEPDELHYFLRFAVALAAGAALAAAGRHLDGLGRLRPGQGYLLALALCLPFSFPFYWDPPSMDRYDHINRTPIRPKVLAYTQWVREHTPNDAIFVAGRSASAWIPALAGRQVLLAEAGNLLPPDYDERKNAERIFLTSEDPALIRATALRFRVTHLAIDAPMQEEYQTESYYELARGPAYRTLFANSAVRLVEIVP